MLTDRPASIRFRASLRDRESPERAFAFDALERTPECLERCTRLEKLSLGPHAAGTRVRRSYRERGRAVALDGVVATRVPNEPLALRHARQRFETLVEFASSHAQRGARIVHAIELTPKTLALRLFAPLIRSELTRQATVALERLRRLLET